MRIELNQAVLRPWRANDVDALALHANDRAVWRNLRDQFPHPYTREDAVWWVEQQLAAPVPRHTAVICVEDQLAGAIGVVPGKDICARSWEIGYWLGRAFWGRGIATEALRAFTRYAFEEFPCDRLHAGVFGWNRASARVLEKAGYTLEGCLRRDVFKDGEYTDHLIYGILREEAQSK
ncbi:MAG: GNAT family N-acetyltransferase [Candidatus Hydrogenedentes bacterium]|nr:GNAT family N-acetyltransferase [Candidatus Hydrogenedentota bacterium]